jgi:hypothetical protein
MNIVVTETPSGSIPPVEVAGRFDPDRGSLQIQFSPTDRTPGAVALTLLDALGKDLRVTGSHAVRTAEHRIYAPIWVRAQAIHTVAVVNAQSLRPDTVEHLIAMIRTVEDLILVCEPGHAPSTVSRFRTLTHRGHPVAPTPWHQFEHTCPKHAPRAVPVPRDGYALGHLPPTDFTLFRDACRRVNSHHRFAAIDAEYVWFYKAGKTVPPDIDSVIDHIADITREATTTAPILVAVRATQNALFDRGWLLQAQADKLLGTLTSVRHPKPTPEHWRALLTYIRPERAATVALYLLGVPTTALNTRSVADIRSAVTQGSISDQPIPKAAIPLLTAELLRREHEHASADDSYLNLRGARRHLEILIDARRDLAIPIDARRDLAIPIDGRNLRDDHLKQSTRPLYRLGLKVSRLA